MGTKPDTIIVAYKDGITTHHGNWKLACSFYGIEPNAVYVSFNRKRKAGQSTDTYKSRKGVTLTKTVLL